VWLRFNRLGADCTINYKENPNYTGTVKIETKLDGVDLIFDPILASNFMMVRPKFLLTLISKRMSNVWHLMPDGLYMEQWAELWLKNAVFQKSLQREPNFYLLH
jgi:hypothetical protein